MGLIKRTKPEFIKIMKFYLSSYKIGNEIEKLKNLNEGKFEIIDGNHRFEKAFRDGKKTINSYKIYAEELIPYFYDQKGHECFVNYWNSKLDDE